MAETNSEKFKRVATQRIENVLKSIVLLGDCANTYSYEYTEQEVGWIFSAIDSTLNATKSKFGRQHSQMTHFSFDEKQNTGTEGKQTVLDAETETVAITEAVQSLFETEKKSVAIDKRAKKPKKQKNPKLCDIVESKMRRLSNEGHVFPKYAIKQMTDEEWSERIFGIGSSFARHRGNSLLYWEAGFAFGDTKLWIYRYWSAEHRDAVMKWFDNLPISYIGKKPRRLILPDGNYPVKDWYDLVTTICEVLHSQENYKDILEQLDKNEKLNTARRRTFSRSKTLIKDKDENIKDLSFGMYFSTNRDADETVELCEKILEECGYSRYDMKIVLKEGS